MRKKQNLLYSYLRTLVRYIPIYHVNLTRLRSIESKESNHYYFHYAWRLPISVLAYMLDSSGRVSRRGNENHFVRITGTYVTYLSLIQDKYRQVNTHKGPPTNCTVIPGKTHPDRHPTTASLLQVRGKIWSSYALVSIAHLSAISGTF